MAKDWSNLKNQPKKVEEVEKIDDEIADEEDIAEETTDEAEEADEVEDEVVETKAEKKAREKAEAKAKSEEKADEEDTSDDIYFVNSKTLNLETMVGKFFNGVFIAKTSEQAECIRKTEDFVRGFVKELSESEYKKTLVKSK